MAFKAWLRKEIQNKAQNFLQMVENERKIPAVGEVLCGDTFYTHIWQRLVSRPPRTPPLTLIPLYNTNTYIFSAARVAFYIIPSPGKKMKQTNKPKLSQFPHAPPPPAKN